MNKLIVLIGPPCSGKSTYVKTVLEVDPDIVVVSRDNIRLMLYGKGYKQNAKDEEVISEIEHTTISSLLSKKKTVIIDGCNVKAEYLDNIKEKYSYLAKIEFILVPQLSNVELTPEILVDRNIKRFESGQHWQNVPEEIIRKFYNRYQSLINTYDFSTIEKEPIKAIIPSFKLPPTYIFDIDGTLLQAEGRSHYNATDEEILNDIPVVSTMAIFELFYNTGLTDILLVTGREEKYRDVTIKWFTDRGYAINSSKLFMRASKDYRPDYIVKREIYNNQIKENFDVIGVFEDRKQVIEKCWNKLGLFVFDVGQGKNWY